jgi:hypothetical protein
MSRWSTLGLAAKHALDLALEQRPALELLLIADGGGHLPGERDGSLGQVLLDQPAREIDVHEREGEGDDHHGARLRKTSFSRIVTRIACSIGAMTRINADLEGRARPSCHC